MRKLIMATVVFSLAGLSASYARGGMHGGGMHGMGMHGMGMQGQMAPANPTVPPSLTPDPGLTGSAPLPPHHQPTSADVLRSRMPCSSRPLKRLRRSGDRNICRGC